MKPIKQVVAVGLLLLLHVKVQSMNAQHLKCEYRESPMGVDAAHPRLSWKLESRTRGDRQSAYHVLVASTPEILAQDKADLWDSGKQASDQNTQLEYAGRALASNASCHWKVRIWDKEGKPGEWSKPARWISGLLKPQDWTAKWIGKDETTAAMEQLLPGAKWIWYPDSDPANSAQAGPCWFRQTLTVPAGSTVTRALCHITADNAFILHVNGNEIGRGGSFNAAMEYELTSQVTPGENVIGIFADNHGGTPNPAGMIASIRVEFDSGEPLRLTTDGNWRVTRQHTPTWGHKGHDESGWQKARVLGDYGMKPWGEPQVADDYRRLPARMLRRDFNATQQIKRATAHVSGLGLFELYVNGSRISDNVLQPALTDYDKQVPYVTFDVTEKLKPGANSIGVWLGNGRYFAPRLAIPVTTRTFGYPKLLLQLEVEYTDGTSARIVSDESWKLTTEGPITANNEYDGEDYDARKELPGWCSPAFDDSKWQKPQVVSAPDGALVAQPIEPIRVTETLKPIAITEPQPGLFIADMGQNMVGWCRIKVNGTAGMKVRLRHAETLTTGGLLYLDNIRGAKVTENYTLKGGAEEVYEPRFTYHGFRYVEITGWPGKPDASAIEGRVVHDDMPRSGTFSCSNELLNRLYHNILWGTRGNYRSIPTDCPQRDERQGWLGDRSEECRGESYLYDVAAFYAKWVQDIQDSQKPTGSVPDVAPNYWPFYNDGITWPSSFVIIPHTVYTQYGDRRVLEKHYDGMKLWMDYMTTYVKDGLMPKNTYGDWCVPPENPKLIHSEDPKRQTNPELVSSSYYYHDAMLMAGTARMLGKSPDAEKFEKLAQTLKDAFNKKFLKAGVYDNGSQTAAVLPLAFGMVPEDQKRPVFEHLVKKIEQETDGHIGTGLIGGQWLMRVLSDNGRADLAYRIASQKSYPSWGYMLENGATTIWELWNGNTADPAMNSHNHVMLIGDLNIWFTEYLAGIRPSSPGFKTFTIHPHLVGDLKWAKADIESPHGRISSSWKRDGENGVTLDVYVPSNTQATVYVPAAGAEGVTESGKPASAAEGVKFVRMQNGAAVFELGAGNYAFRAKQ
ncbi:MAG: family 78 glycoside hydrolase catalytic domain [Candidatus Sumerlaeaceae bacterium]